MAYRTFDEPLVIDTQEKADRIDRLLTEAESVEYVLPEEEFEEAIRAGKEYLARRPKK
jgi:hypothetical protein